ncbi:MAG: class I SAM-dependent methyltransferase [Rhizonema sp. PD38]|nr:class I SAM-dependent methyltransferase [Rhizonema sp. PD38]
MNFDNSQLKLHSSVDHSQHALCEIIADRIAASPHRRITFSEYMDMALYHPKHGYYSTKAVNLGQQGDFFTSVHLGGEFGELLMVQFLQMWEIMGRPVPFSLVEMGAGQGFLALDILKSIQQNSDFFKALNYIIVEKSSALRQEQQQRLQEFPVSWCDLEEIPSNSIVGCFFSNELVDAFPVHQFILKDEQLQEIYVTTSTDGEENKVSASSSRPTPSFVEVSGEPSTIQLTQYLDLVGINALSAYPDGFRSEINLAALHWLGIVANRLQRGYVLTIDYGYSASRYYNPRRSQGTLQCYYQHQRHNNPYINVGRQDITTHVDFTALERWGQSCGIDKVGFTQQGLFLMALGLGERLAMLSYTEQPTFQLLRRRDSLHQLLDPLGLGGFGVLVQNKGLTKTETIQPLKGLIVPDQT